MMACALRVTRKTKKKKYVIHLAEQDTRGKSSVDAGCIKDG